MWVHHVGVGLSEEAVIRGGKWVGLEQGGLTTGHFSYSDSEGHWQKTHACLPSQASGEVQPACGVCGSGVQGSGFGKGRALLGREEPEKEVGVVRTCLIMDFGDFTDAHPTPLKMSRGDRTLKSWCQLFMLL